MRTSESTQITTKLIPKLVQEAKIPIENIKTDCTTSLTGSKRVDIIISMKRNDDRKFEEEIVTLIEVKQRNTPILDIYDINGNVKEEIKQLIEKNLYT